MGRTVKVAAAQLAPVFLSRDATVAKACDAIAEAAANGAELIAFPESFIPGYPYWALTRDPMSTRELNRRLFDDSMTIPGPECDVLADAAKKANCHVVIGLTEREGGTLYNSQLIIGGDGTILGKRRKLMPTSHERMIWGRGDGRDLEVWDTPLGRLGALICYEHSNGLYRYAIQAQGEQIHIANWPGGIAIDRIIDAAARHYAFEGQCFVINVTAVLTEEIIAEAAAERLHPGGGYSAIIAPNGNFLAGPATEGETILYADLDFDLITDMKMIVDSAGHYARPDVLRLHIDRRPQKPLITDDE
ncbi:MAG TPA: carbon-nitrogen hydrolase family protein [Pseudolabrys sp.]|nr:carbon-nitrogen hydrolase family protein [Pseudolabrys sp.]